jgi:uncharacterized protein Veg
MTQIRKFTPFQRFLKKVYYGSFCVETALHRMAFRVISFSYNLIVLTPIKFVMRLNAIEPKPLQDHPEQKY